jgi:hypothetical protein
MRIDKLKNIIQSSHINFLIGSGLSVPYLTTLANIELWLTQCADIEDSFVRSLIEDNLKMKYVQDVMSPCLSEHRTNASALEKMHTAYCEFLTLWNYILSRRGGSILGKQVNIFTTNIDPFVEEAAEELGVEFNNGFKGIINPILREDSFNTTVNKVSPLFQKTSEVPTFNYLKIHGSINWSIKEQDTGIISYDSQLATLRNVVKAISEYPAEYLILGKSQLEVDEKNASASPGTKMKFTFEDIIRCANACNKQICEENQEKIRVFREAYDKLVMVHPRKTKFKETVLDLHFYELMRLYSNALEKTNSCLFVAGFSFADEHIAQITLRAASSNPTLQIIIFAYNSDAKEAINKSLGKSNNDNILILSVDDFKESQDETDKTLFEGLSNFDLTSINQYIFDVLRARIY